MSTELPFDAVARLPFATDNVAVATRVLDPGTAIRHGEVTYTLSHGVLEGHRFVVAPIAAGGELLSWGLPFGKARTAMAPGTYLINERMFKALSTRKLPFKLPAAANFDDVYEPYVFDAAAFKPTPVGAPEPSTLTFDGFVRQHGRGTGTRNYVVVMGLTAAAGAYAQAICDGAPVGRELATRFPMLDGVAPVAHTEGGGRKPNNIDYVLRTLAGFAVHPNVGALLLLDDGDANLSAGVLLNYMKQHKYHIEHVPYEVLRLGGPLATVRQQGQDALARLMPLAARERRTPCSLSQLKVGLQCGGSDAFSGISANPLIGWIAHAVTRAGGWANLAETDELIGAESYVLQHVTSLDVAERFLGLIARYRELAGRHGHSPEGNPSGGNYYRGLYNIVIKSIGAAQKKHPKQRLHGVVDYGERMTSPGYYFMDSPGNDLESVAGQVATGCNLIYFTTGNGSVTNFPFVPTIKVVTTTGRYNLLPKEMDINAGRFLDGLSMDELGKDSLALSLRVASGTRSAGEVAGHSQVQLWRDWAQSAGSTVSATADAASLDGKPLVTANRDKTASGYEVAPPSLGLVAPTSLCSGQIGRLIARGLTRDGLGVHAGLKTFTALAHTEGCGVSSGASESIYVRTLLGYASHPLVGATLFLEHGCEKTHNDYMRQALTEAGVKSERFGFASIQLDGGMASVTEKVREWVRTRPAIDPDDDDATEPSVAARGSIGLMTIGPLDEDAAAVLATLARRVLAAGWSVIVPESDALLRHGAMRSEFANSSWDSMPRATLAYAQVPKIPGLHGMAAPNPQASELITGLGACGARAIIVHVVGAAVPAHPLVPMLLVSADGPTAMALRADLDLAVPEFSAYSLNSLLAETLIGDYVPHLAAAGLVHVQVTRGLTGFSL